MGFKSWMDMGGGVDLVSTMENEVETKTDAGNGVGGGVSIKK